MTPLPSAASARRRRPIITLTSGLLAAAAIAACSSDSPPRNPLTVREGVQQAVDSLPVYVMKDRGFAAREGLRLIETPLPGGAVGLERMADGSIDAGVVSVVAMAAAAQHGVVPAKVVGVASAAFSDRETPFAAVVAAHDVRSWTDLAARPIAVNDPTSLGAIAVRSRMRLERAPPPRLVEIPFPNMGLAVRTGDVGGAAMFEPYITQSLQRGDGHILGWVIGGPPMQRAEASVLTMRSSLLRRRPQAAKRYLRAYLDAVTWIASHPTEARKVLARRLVLSRRVATGLRLPRYAADGRSDAAQLAPVVDITVRTLGGKAIAAGRLLDERLLDEVLAER